MAKSFLNYSSSPSENIFPPVEGLVSDELYYAFAILNYVVLCAASAIFGIVSNFINMRVFLHMGFAETVNISFFALAISDLILQFSALFICVFCTPWFEESVEEVDALYFITTWLNVIPTTITGWITAFVALERCLCILMPLKIKDIITPGRTKAINAFIFIFTTVCIVPIYFSMDIKWDFDPDVNKTVLSVVMIESRRDLMYAMNYLNNVVITLVSFAAVVICTLLLIIGVYRTSQKRSQLANLKEDNSTKVRDRQVIKMVTFISITYLLCYTPFICIILWLPDSDFYLPKRVENLYYILASFAYFFETFNSSINIFIYFKMSSKYRETFESVIYKKKR